MLDIIVLKTETCHCLYLDRTQNLLSWRHTSALGVSIQPLDHGLLGASAVDPARHLGSRDGAILMESLAVDKPSKLTHRGGFLA